MQERCAFTPMKIRNERNSPHISVDGAHRFSAACLLITPSLDEYKKLVRCALNNDDFLEHPDADCDIVNHYFEERIQSIPYFYNVAKSVQTYHSGLWCEIDLRSVHYTPEKPWEMNFKSIISTGTPVAQTYKWWWQVQEQLLAEEIIEHD
jgi:lipopolysaccharide biosynthesis glycosyltransferase